MDNNVAIYVDGVYMPSTTAGTFDLPDVEIDAGLLQIEAAGICGSDWGSYRRNKTPRIMGHENIARVANLGSLAAKNFKLKEGDRIAAVIIEPIPANHGLLLQSKEFLLTLRRLTREAGALLIFDEVISGFRVARGGAAELFGITPDLATFGKVIGGGLPVGAYGGSKQLMSHIAPEGPVYQAGTLSGNPVAMAAGLATLRILEREKAWTKLEEMGAKLEKEVTAALADVTVPWAITRVGSIFWLSFQGAAPRSAEALDQTAGARFKPLFHSMLERGIYLPPSAYEVMFLSLAHTAEDVSLFVRNLRGVIHLTAA